MKKWPVWWHWELELTPHLFKRMADRGFTELELRAMLQATTRLRRDIEPDRWVAVTRLRRQRWEIILEPDPAEERLVVITAYPMPHE